MGNTSISNADLSVAFSLADAAGEAILPHFRTPSPKISNKAKGGAFDPVTAADKAAEASMRAILRELRPEDGILGEEDAPKAGTSGLTWVLDPIDGTRAFISGTPTWGTLIGLNAGDAPFLGIIDQPFLEERFWAFEGKAWYRRRGSKAQPMRVRACESLSQATLFSTFPEIGTAAERAAFAKVDAKVQLTRYGTDCYAYAMLAFGQIDLVIEAGLQSYDIQGPMAVVEGAGGIVTNWQGNPVHDGGQVIAAGSERIHAEALKLLNGG